MENYYLKRFNTERDINVFFKDRISICHTTQIGIDLKGT